MNLLEKKEKLSPLNEYISYNYVLRGDGVKHVSMVDYEDGSNLEEKVNEWILSNEENLLEIVDIEYTQYGNVYLATITYLERD